MAQKNRLQYIILGLLNIESKTGYDLTKAFDSDIGEFWSANHSQIYPLLKKMEQENIPPDAFLRRMEFPRKWSLYA